MSFTRIDSHFYRGDAASYDTSSFTALNPNQQPGSFVAAGAMAARESLGGQVACKLALEHFVDGVLGYFDGREPRSKREDGEISLEVLETAFRKANSSVYQFGHSLAAGGRMAASLIGLVIEHSTISVGRVGYGSAYLVRGGESFPFFEPPVMENLTKNRGAFIGSNSLVPVELASVPIEEGDSILVFSDFLEVEKEQGLGMFLSDYDWNEGQPCKDLCQYLFPDMVDLSFAMIARVGPDTIYLSKVLGEQYQGQSQRGGR